LTEWLRQNLLAVYAAVVGTLALVLNLSGFLHDVRKSAVRLRVLCRPHSDLQNSLSARAAAANSTNTDRRTLFEAYRVTVFNDGSVPAHIQEVGVTCTNRCVETALVSQPGGNRLLLLPVADSDLEAIPPKSSQDFTIYFRVDRDVFTPKKAFAVDKTGKKWQGKVSV
jgi:hypothetical protein